MEPAESTEANTDSVMWSQTYEVTSESAICTMCSSRLNTQQNQSNNNGKEKS